MSTETTELVWPPDLLDDEEQDEPLAGQDHRDVIDTLQYPLRCRLSSPTCFVAAELRVHRDRSNLRDYREPDLLVAFDVPDHLRQRYLLWAEGKAPDLVIEILSPSSADNDDLGTKRIWYREIGVREYIVLDPSGEFAPEPRLQAWRYRPSGEVHVLPDADGRLASVVIPFLFVLHEGFPRLLDPVTGEVFPPIWEAEPRLRVALQAERAARAQAETLTEAALAEAQRAHAVARQAQEQARVADERYQAEVAARRVLEEELAVLRRQRRNYPS